MGILDWIGLAILVVGTLLLVELLTWKILREEDRFGSGTNEECPNCRQFTASYSKGVYPIDGILQNGVEIYCALCQHTAVVRQ